jgi:hypothetical protein
MSEMKPEKVFEGIKLLGIYDDYLVGTKGYSFYEYNLKEKRWKYKEKIHDPINNVLSRLFITRRLFRAEVTKLYTLKDGTQFCIAKKGIFRKKLNEKKFAKCYRIIRGSRPLNLCIDSHENIYFGEYFNNIAKKEVHIYRSSDKGNNWNIAYTFPSGCINHIHGLFWDPYTDLIWVATGDRGNECIIGKTNNGFKSFDIVFQGGQEYRTTHLLFYKDFIIYATDSQYIKNEIKKVDRQSDSIKVLQEIQGSAIKVGQCGNLAFLSTTVEPSEVNRDNKSHLWISNDGIHWKEVFSAEKDFLPPVFQFGCLEFPNYSISQTNLLYFSGRAVKKIGGNSTYFKL